MSFLTPLVATLPHVWLVSPAQMNNPTWYWSFLFPLCSATSTFLLVFVFCYFLRSSAFLYLDDNRLLSLDRFHISPLPVLVDKWYISSLWTGGNPAGYWEWVLSWWRTESVSLQVLCSFMMRRPCHLPLGNSFPCKTPFSPFFLWGDVPGPCPLSTFFHDETSLSPGSNVLSK